MTIRNPLKLALDGYVFDAQVTDHWAQVSITPTSGPTHYMRLPHADAARLGQYLVAALSPPEPTEGQIERVRRLNDSKDPMFRNGWNGACDALYAALRAMPLQDHGWQDISTAPKDRPIQAHDLYLGVVTAMWFPAKGAERWTVVAYGNEAARDTNFDRFELKDLTHWRPLPAAPAMVAEERTDG